MSYLGVPPFGQTVRTITESLATAGQTTFSPSGGYLPGYIDVFLNGSALGAADFTATNGSTVVLNVAAALNDEFKAIAYWPVSLIDTYRKAEADALLAARVGTTSSVSMRNRIINGDMRIDQRNAGAAWGTSINGYTVDRWQMFQSVTGKVNGGQNYNSITPPAGFRNYIGVQSQSSYSIGAGDYYFLQQIIEGYNVADLGFGTANAQPITLSFWVRSSLTGTFGLGFTMYNSGAGTFRGYTATYTISAADTWEYKTVTIPGDTGGSGTWLYTNGIGLRVNFALGVGSTYTQATGSWTSANVIGATGATSVVGTSGATFYITGVQLEAGTVATPFERRDYGRELMMCQRYYQNVNYGGTWYTVGTGVFVDMEDRALGGPQFFVPMRATPTTSITADGGASQSIRSYGGDPVRTITSLSVTAYGVASVAHSGGYTLGRSYSATWKAEAEL